MEYLQGRRFHHLSGQPVSVFDHLHFLTSNKNFLCWKLCPLVLNFHCSHQRNVWFFTFVWALQFVWPPLVWSKHCNLHELGLTSFILKTVYVAGGESHWQQHWKGVCLSSSSCLMRKTESVNQEHIHWTTLTCDEVWFPVQKPGNQNVVKARGFLVGFFSYWSYQRFINYYCFTFIFLDLHRIACLNKSNVFGLTSKTLLH